MGPKQVTGNASSDKSVDDTVDACSPEAIMAMDSFHHEQEIQKNALERNLSSKDFH